jgi:hypothetical protein
MQIALIEPIANSTRAITGLRQDKGGKETCPASGKRRRIRNVPERAVQARAGDHSSKGLGDLAGRGGAAELSIARTELALINQRNGSEKKPRPNGRGPRSSSFSRQAGITATISSVTGSTITISSS